MRAFWAMIVDSYRELNSKRLFWIILVLSALLVLMYGSIGFDDTGMSMFFGLVHIDQEYLTHDSPLSRMLYRGIFSSFIVPLWLGWIATILALISTASVFPDFVAGGSIDLVLAKPISRVRLFVCKFLASLLFVALQVTLACAGVFLCMGLRLGDWEWRLFAAIPLVVLFYSYLFSFCVLIGVWTRSTLAALLLTLLLWFGLYAVNQTEAIMAMIRTQTSMQAEDLDRRINDLGREKSRLAEEGVDDANVRRIEVDIANLTDERDQINRTVATLDPWYRLIRTVKAPLPKTGETIDLLNRLLIRESDVNLMDVITGNVRATPDGGFEAVNRTDDREAMQRIESELTSRSAAFIIGSSLGFETVVLALACLIFVRRDF